MPKKWTIENIHLAECNRDVSEKHVEKLKESIQKNGYQEGMPILVDPNGFIVDGQHRYVACKQLKVDAPIVEVQDIKLALQLNSTQLAWGIKDYVKFYASQGYPDYIILRNLCNAKNISLTTGINMICGKSVGKANSLAKSNPVKEGTFTIADKSAKGLAKIEKRIDHILRLVSLLDLPRTDRLVLAITRLAEDPNFVFTTMENKISYQKARIYRCTTIQEYMVMLSNIYNNKNPKKVTV